MASQRRQPEPNTEVYDLGHNETMQVDLALAFVGEYLENGLTNRRLLDQIVENLNLATIDDIAHIFAAYGTVTVIRRNQED